MHSIIIGYVQDVMDCPETLITDQGREFVNDLSSALYNLTNTEHRITSAYHPQVNVAGLCFIPLSV